jgi:hypothetical protein
MFNAQWLTSIRVTSNVPGCVETVGGSQVAIDADAAIIVQSNAFQKIRGRLDPKTKDDKVRVETLAAFEDDRLNLPLTGKRLNARVESELHTILPMQPDECLADLVTQLPLQRDGPPPHDRYCQAPFPQAGRHFHADETETCHDGSLTSFRLSQDGVRIVHGP